MPEYRRVIAYIYCYENGERKEQTGYVKSQSRGDEWRLHVCLQKSRVSEQKPYSIYLCVQETEGLWGIPLDELGEGNGVFEWNGLVKPDIWAENPFTERQVKGICIGYSSDIHYAAEWDDCPVEVSRFRVYRGNSEMEQRKADARELRETDSQEALNPEIVEEEKVHQEFQRFQKSQESEEAAETEEAPKLRATAVPIVSTVQEEVVHAADRRQKNWEYLAERFPVQTLCRSGGAPIACIRIGPRALKRLPRDSWVLGNNSFLLHGYYQHGHLLLCRQEKETGTEYSLGVPGIYNEKEQMMAELFGFGNFLRSGNLRNVKGEYGYWFRKIEDTYHEDNR